MVEQVFNSCKVIKEVKKKWNCPNKWASKFANKCDTLPGSPFEIAYNANQPPEEVCNTVPWGATDRELEREREREREREPYRGKPLPLVDTPLCVFAVCQLQGSVCRLNPPPPPPPRHSPGSGADSTFSRFLFSPIMNVVRVDEVLGEDEDSIPLADDDPSAIVDDSIADEDKVRLGWRN